MEIELNEMELKSVTALERGRDDHDISKLGRDMKEMVFAKLSFETICSSRAVCKEWNSILSSHSFLSLPIQNPWLLICDKKIDGNWSCMAYHFSAQKWIPLPLYFLPNLRHHNIRDLSGTGQGLLLFRETPTPQLFVCNPLIKSYREIKLDLTDKFIHIVERGNNGPYLVVWSHSNLFFFQIYHYFQDSWRIKFQFEGESVSNILCREIVECNGVIFWRGISPRTIVGYNIKDEGFIKPVTVAPLPHQMDGPDVHILSMVSYGNSVLVVGFTTPIRPLRRTIILDRPMFANCPMFVGMVIWELFEDEDEEDELVWKWEEFASMPLPQFLKEGDQICVCVGDYLCFSSKWGGESATVFAYNLKEGFWHCLPPCNSYYREERMIMSFEPKFNSYPILGKSRE
ncbi:hypothetical protein SUGI_0249290 [Cryptomeria japonica]|uniref:F-box/kelch-repeat protein At5g15710-like n=1 Tax=Cryptomeria japonica TaxID=3369 RepID=UPI002408EBEA|nr:F-box/kelch-repeat protein At5g15710-like [Cryptomeria japonica]GLJ15243.1 hypothetical protein SUGI_0249290 [Cryptomeria japonica]